MIDFGNCILRLGFCYNLAQLSLSSELVVVEEMVDHNLCCEWVKQESLRGCLPQVPILGKCIEGHTMPASNQHFVVSTAVACKLLCFNSKAQLPQQVHETRLLLDTFAASMHRQEDDAH